MKSLMLIFASLFLFSCAATDTPEEVAAYEKESYDFKNSGTRVEKGLDDDIKTLKGIFWGEEEDQTEKKAKK